MIEGYSTDQVSSSPHFLRWNEVTWYSKLLSVIFMLGVLPAIAFYVGVEYERTEQEISSEPVQIHVPPRETKKASSLPGSVSAEPDSWPPGSVYAKDASHVYYFKGMAEDKTILKEADPLTFIELGGRYGKDKRAIYYATAFGGVYEIEAADLATFKYLGEMKLTTTQVNPTYATDKNSVYLQEDVILGADPKTFSLLTHDYSRDSQNVFWLTEKIPEADPETFEIMNYQYAKDKNSVYRGGTAVPGLDPKTFDGIDRG